MLVPFSSFLTCGLFKDAAIGALYIYIYIYIYSARYLNNSEK